MQKYTYKKCTKNFRRCNILRFLVHFRRYLLLFYGEKRYLLEWIADGKIKAMRLAEAWNIEVTTL